MQHSVSTTPYRHREQGPVHTNSSRSHVIGCAPDRTAMNVEPAMAFNSRGSPSGGASVHVANTNSGYLKGTHGLIRQALQYNGPSPLGYHHVQTSIHGFTNSHAREGFTELKTVPKSSQNMKPNDSGHLVMQPQLYTSAHFNGPSSRYLDQQQQQKQQQQQQDPNGASDDIPRPNRFPPAFDPRGTPNMSHKEKVNKWLSDIPIYLTTVTKNNKFSKLENEFEDSGSTTGCVSIWRNECYQGIVETSSTVSNDDGNLSTSLDEEMRYEYDDQSYCWPLMMNDNSSFNMETSVGLLCTGFKFGLFVDHDDVLEYQSRKITRYVKKLYREDRSEAVMKLNQVSMEYTGNKTDNSQSNIPQNDSTTGAYLTHDDMDEDEYYDLCNVNPMTIPALPRRKRRYL